MRIFPILLAILCSSFLQAQILDPVDWSFSSRHIQGDEFEIVFTATLDDGWYVYTQYLDGEDGPIPTSFNYDGTEHFDMLGKNEERSDYRKEGHDALFDMQIVKFAKKVDFVQKVKIRDYNKPVKGYLEYMTCDDGRCLPPEEIDFSFVLQSAGSKKETKSDKSDTGANQKQEIDDTPAIAVANVDNSEEETAGTETEETSGGQFFDPVKWEMALVEKGDNNYQLTATARIDKGWYVYSQFVEDGGPIPTTFYWDESDSYELVGKAEEESKGKVDGFDKIFEMDVIKYKDQVRFVQNIKTSDTSAPLTGALEFMTCDDERCLPPQEIPFEVNFASLKALIGANSGDTDNSSLAGTSSDIIPAVASLEPINNSCGDHRLEEKKGLWNIFILGVLGGLVALLTPCVFPMIPLTVSFFTKGSEDKKKGISNAFLYSFFILMVYLVLSIPFHLMDSINPDILNEVSTNIWLNIAFFLIFMFFAGSFFGYYELTLPESWTNRASSAEGVGGIIGIFFMALTLALVSFSCTGPILGSLLAGALTADGGAMQLTAGMGGFGLALALPFGLFAAFPSWMNSLPRSGGWLNTVKVVLGFLEVALAFKFLSNADLVKHWGLLKIEPFLFIWILTFLGLGLYLFGKIKFPHDSPISKLSIGRVFFGTLSLAFVVYLATGFMYDQKAGSLKSLTLLSGLAPPACYSWWHPCDCPQNLKCFKDYEEGLAYAKENNKPIMIDFTGHACVNCRKMEEQVWPKTEVYDLIDQNYVLISLYVDEKIDLPAEEQIEVPRRSGGTRTLRTTGNKWAYFQSENFGNNSQPWYVLLSSDGQQLLNNPVGYTPDSREYADFLRCGLQANEELNQLSIN